MQVSTSSLSQGAERWTGRHCAADESRRYQSQGYAVAASTASMVICLLTVSKAQRGLRGPGTQSLGHSRLFPSKKAKRKEGK